MGRMSRMETVWAHCITAANSLWNKHTNTIRQQPKLPRKSEISTTVIPIRRQSIISTSIGDAGRTKRGVAQTITWFGLPELIRKTNPSSLPGAGHLRQQSTPCDGHQRKLSGLISAQRVSDVLKNSNENTICKISKFTGFPSNRSAV